jgi:hypothetical protein
LIVSLKLIALVRKQLSSNLLAEKIVQVIVLLLIVFLWTVVLQAMVFFIVFLILWSYSVYVVYFLAKNVSYDESNLYIKIRNQEKVIDLKNITQIKLVPRSGSWRRLWRIRYLNNNQEQSVLLLLRYGIFSLRQFVKVVKIKNPAVDLVYIVLDIDFD